MENLRVVDANPEVLLAMRNVLKAYASRDVYISVQKASTQTVTAKDSALQVLYTNEHYTKLIEPLDELLYQMAEGKKGLFVLTQQVYDQYRTIFEKNATREDFGFIDQTTYDQHLEPLLKKLPEIRTIFQNAPSVPKEKLFKQQSHDFESEMGIPSLAARAYPPKKSYLS